MTAARNGTGPQPNVFEQAEGVLAKLRKPTFTPPDDLDVLEEAATVIERLVGVAKGRKMLAFSFEHCLLVMQAAWIEWKHGKGAERAMEWIENTLDGPDTIPRVEETGTDAQAFYDRERDRQHTEYAEWEKAHG